jgi:hypothetical protein
LFWEHICDRSLSGRRFESCSSQSYFGLMAEWSKALR